MTTGSTNCCRSTPSDRSLLYQPAWPGYLVARRTLAMPSNTLFGSTLERLGVADGDKPLSVRDVVHLQQRAVAERSGKTVNGLVDVPKAVQMGLGLPDERYMPILTRLQGKLRSNKEACKWLNEMELRNKYFTPAETNKCAPDGRNHVQIESTPTVNRKDCKKVETERTDLKNRRYPAHKPPPPVHEYAIMGDPVRPGARNTWKTCPRSRTAQIVYDDKYKPTCGDFGADDTPLAEGMPRNIKHKYGSNVCRDLLAERKVGDTAQITRGPNASVQHKNDILACGPRGKKKTTPPACAQKDPISEEARANIAEEKRLKAFECECLSRSKYRQKLGDCGCEKRLFSPDGASAEKNIVSGSPSYEEMSHTLRHNIPGYIYRDHTLTDMKRNFTQKVFDERFPDPTEFRMRRDEHSEYVNAVFKLKPKKYT